MSHVRALTGAVMLGVQPSASSAAFTIGVSQIGVGQLGLGPWEMIDVTDRCRAIATDRGRSEPYGQFRAGTGSVELDNRDGGLIWSDTPQPGAVRPGSPIVISGRPFNAGPHDPVLTAVVDDLHPHRNIANSDETLVITATEVKRDLASAANEIPAQLGAGELTGARLNRILDELEPVPLASERDIDAGTVTMTQTFTSQDPETLLEVAEATAFAEGGALFTDRRGRFAFRDRNTAGALRLTATDTPGDLYRLPNLTPRLTHEYVINDVTLSKVGSSSIRVADAASVESIRRRSTFKRVDLPIQLNVDVTTLANHYLQAWTQQTLAQPLQLSAARAPWADVLTTLELYEELQLERAFSSSPAFDMRVRIDAIAHSWRAGEPWVTTLGLSTIPTE